MASKRCFFAECCDQVVCNSETTWMPLSEVKNKDLEQTCFPEAQTLLEVMLLRADLFFQHILDLDNAFVCDAHYTMLVQPFYVMTKSMCDTCVDVRGSQLRNKGRLRNINVSQAITLCEIFKVKHSYGKVICPRCRIELGKYGDITRKELHNDAFTCLFDSECPYCMKSNDPDYYPPLETVTHDEKIKEQRTALNKFLAASGSTKKVLCTESYKDLSHRVKLRYIYLAKTIFASIASFMTKDDAEMFTLDVFNELRPEYSNIKLDGNFCQVMSGVSEAYSNAESWLSRREILSIVAPKLPLKILQLFIPGLTDHRFSAARFHATACGIGSRVCEKVNPVRRFTDSQIAHFVDFIISPHVCIDLPFGEKILKLSAGIELNVPDTIRNMGPTRIVEQYFSYCEELCQGFEPLSRSSLFTILDVCKASTRKSLQGIDHFAADAAEGFEGIKKMIENNTHLSSESTRLIENLKRARLYLKSDYKVHVARFSSVADHCCVYALSDQKKKDFAYECNHDHKEICSECSNVTSTLDEIECLLETSETDDELLDRSLSKFRLYRESIEAWKAHLLRSINQDLCREELLDKLASDEIYINLDWAMKFLPVKSREPQSEFFGKRGISWHVTVVMKTASSQETPNNDFDEVSDISDELPQFYEFDMTDLSEEIESDNTVSIRARKNVFEYKVFVHVFDESAQDSDIVLAILKDVLSRVKNSDPQIAKAFIRSDNAGCYHSADTIVSAIHMWELTGIVIKRVDFCDPQGGKGPCDRYAAVIKSHIRRYLNENHNVTNASEFVEACHSYKGVKGVLALNCTTVKDNVKRNKKCTIKQITNYYNFEYTEEGLLVHRSWDVGTGLLLHWSQLKFNRSIGNILSNRDVDCHQDWLRSKQKYDCGMMETDNYATSRSEILPSSNKEKKLFECNAREGCTAAFMKFGNLINHILLGDHKPSIERFSLKDTAMKTYYCKLEEVGSRRIISVDVNEKQINQLKRNPLSKGWALPIRKPNKEFSSKQREYLEAKFNQGVSGVKHWKPKDVVADMENLRVKNKFYFSASEILKENQIRSFFGRMKRERQMVSSKESNIIPMDIDNNTGENTNEENDHEEIESDLEVLEDFQDIEAAIEETTVIENIFASAKTALETSAT